MFASRRCLLFMILSFLALALPTCGGRLLASAQDSDRIPDLVRALQSNEPRAQLAAALLMIDLVHKNEKSELLIQELRQAGAELPRVLLETRSEEVRVAVIEAIGHVRPRRVFVVETINLSGPAFQKALEHRSPPVRLAVARALGTHIGRTLQETRSAPLPEQRFPLMKELLDDATAFAPTLARALQDSEASVRLAGLQSSVQLFNAVGELQKLIDVPDASEEAGSYGPVRAALVPLSRQLAPLLANAGAALRTPDPAHQLAAARVTEEAAELIRPHPARTSNGLLLSTRLVPEGAEAASLLRAELVRLEPALHQGLAQGNPELQLAVLDALENLGALARGLTPTVIQTTRGPDRFVRWAAARTLPRIDPDGSKPTAEALGALLADEDFDVRQVALDSLERLGAKNVPALPDIDRVLGRPDAELKISALRTLTATGPAAKALLPTLTVTLKDSDPRVRRQALVLLGDLGANAKPAIPALQEAMRDSDPEVRQAAGRAVLRILAQ